MSLVCRVLGHSWEWIEEKEFPVPEDIVASATAIGNSSPARTIWRDHYRCCRCGVDAYGNLSMNPRG